MRYFYIPYAYKSLGCDVIYHRITIKKTSFPSEVDIRDEIQGYMKGRGSITILNIIELAEQDFIEFMKPPTA